MDIYIDVLVVVNCYICWLVLCATASITHTYVKAKLKFFATLLGGSSSLIILLPSEKPLQLALTIVLKNLSILAIILIAFYGQSIKKKCITLLVFSALNALLAGAVYLLNNSFGNNIFYLSNGVLYFDISLTNLVVTTAFVYILIVIASKLYSRYSDKSHSYRVSFSLRGNSYDLNAIADTGNLAKDIFTGKPIIICTGITLYSKDHDSIHPVPVVYNTVSGEGLLYAYKPESIYIIDERNEKHQVNALVAGIESDSGEKRAIFNPNIL